MFVILLFNKTQQILSTIHHVYKNYICPFECMSKYASISRVMAINHTVLRHELVAFTFITMKFGIQICVNEAFP